jgi:hypothetical protein
MALFTTAEARAFTVGDRQPLANATTYPDAAITAAEAGIAAAFARICGVAFVPTTETDAIVDATGGNALLLPHPRVTAVAAAAYRWGGLATTWTALTVEELAALELDPIGLVRWPGRWWPTGTGRVRLTYTHGYATPPYDIKRAALILCWRWLVGENLGDRTISASNASGGVERFAVAGGSLGGTRFWFGYPEVDATLARYLAGPGVG